MTQPAAKKPTQSPPSAPRRPHSFTHHGITVTDDYAWLKDENWQEVLRDPQVLDADIRQVLEAENGYADSLLGHTAPLQKTLVEEMRGRIKEDDSSVPSPDGPYAYFRKFREGGQHELFGRMPRHGGESHIVLDGDELATAHDYFKFGGSRHSPDHKLVAWSADTKGSEYFSIRVRDWETGQDHDDLIEDSDGAVVWSADAMSLFYVKLDDNHRPMQVWRHRLGTSQADDVLVYEEQDSGWFTHLHESASGRFCVIAGGDHETSEQRLIDLADPSSPPRLVAPRDCIYDCSHVGCRGLVGQGICAGAVVETTVDAGQLPVGGQALQRLVDGGAWTEIQKIDWRPHLAWLSCDATVDLSSEVQRVSTGHLSEVYYIFRTNNRPSLVEAEMSE